LWHSFCYFGQFLPEIFKKPAQKLPLPQNFSMTWLPSYDGFFTRNGKKIPSLDSKAAGKFLF